MKPLNPENDCVYISGPMSGLEGYNYEAFHAAEKRLMRAGWRRIINPAVTGVLDTRDMERPTWHDFMAAAIIRMRDATHIHFLPGAEESFGARIEGLVAERNNLGRV